MRRVTPLAALLAVACHKDAPAPSAPEAGPTAPVASPLAPALAPARCQPTAVVHPLGGPGDDLEIGDAVVGPSGVAVGLVHTTATGRIAAVALLPADASTVRVVDLGVTLGDAPPPRVALHGADWIAARYAAPRLDAGPGPRVPGEADARALAISVIAAAGTAATVGSVPQQRDDSFAFDLAPALVAWDEAALGGDATASARGVIRVAELSSDGHAGPPHDASPPESDAESPRVMPLGAGYLALWIARRPETSAPFDAGAAVEVAGEARAFGWLEAVTLDAHGGVSGPVRRLTPPSGHVSVFDAVVLPQGGAILVVARDDGEASDGSGGALLRVVARETSQEPAVAFPTDGLGRGAPSFVAASMPWLSWVSLREETRLLPLDAQGAPSAPPSAEPALDDGRPLAFLGAEMHGSPRKLLAATPADATGGLRELACAGAAGQSDRAVQQ